MIYFDIYFNCIELSQKLREYGFYSCGTIRRDRLRGMQVTNDSIMRKKGRGSYVAHRNAESGVTVIQWFDNKSVLLSSDFLSVEPLNDVTRWDKKTEKYVTVPRPDIVQHYNDSMGGTDLYMFMALYKIDHKSKKWYRRIFFYYLHALYRAGFYTSTIATTFKSQKKTAWI